MEGEKRNELIFQFLHEQIIVKEEKTGLLTSRIVIITPFAILGIRKKSNKIQYLFKQSKQKSYVQKIGR